MKYYMIAMLLVLLTGFCRFTNAQEQKKLAEEYIRGIYGCDSTVVDELAADNIAVSYPIFQKLFNTPAIRGREAVKHFVTHFCNKWKDRQITFHDVVAESSKVVLVWSFKARNAGSIQPDDSTTGQVESWGGITLIRFNKDGKIEAEIGEESHPGPIERITHVR